VKIQAVADGELVLYRLSDGRYTFTGHRPALLEAKKRFAVITDGKPELTDEFLGQMTCEALAFRLHQKQAEGAAPLDEKCVPPHLEPYLPFVPSAHVGLTTSLPASVFVIAAVREYMRFLQFKISDSFIASVTSVNDGEGEMDDVLELWATEWFNLRGAGGRRAAVHNIVALVARQANLV
jgi:hypothetical protein